MDATDVRRDLHSWQFVASRSSGNRMGPLRRQEDCPALVKVGTNENPESASSWYRSSSQPLLGWLSSAGVDRGLLSGQRVLTKILLKIALANARRIFYPEVVTHECPIASGIVPLTGTDQSTVSFNYW